MRALLPAAVVLALLMLPALPAPAVSTSAPSLDCDPACNVRVTTTTGPANEVMVAVNPTNPENLIAVAKDYALGNNAPCSAHNVWMGVYVSHDGGRTWRSKLMPGYPGDTSGQNAALGVYQCSSDPVVAFDARGRAVATGLGYRWQEPIGMTLNGLWVAQSMDGGESWVAASHVAFGATEGALHDKQWIAVDPGTGAAYLSWSLGGFVLLGRSTDGIAWQPPLLPFMGEFGELLPTLLTGVGAQPVIGKKHPAPLPARDVFVVWADNDPEVNTIFETLSIDGGNAYEHLERAAVIEPISKPNTSYRIVTLPSSAVDSDPARVGPNRQNLYIAWADKRFGSNDIVLTRSTDDGHNFDAPVRITDDPPGPNVQFFPAITVGPDGCVHAVWYDRRNDLGNYLVDVYYAKSCDFAQTWSPNLRVTTHSFDPAASYHQHGFAFLGDYIGLSVGSDGVAHPVWADTRTGRADIYTARILP